MNNLEHAIMGLRHVLDAPRRHRSWRWLVRHRMAGVRDALMHETRRGGDAWMAPREASLERERGALLQRLVVLGPLVLDVPDVEEVRRELFRLVTDLEHHRQHLNDLVYDAVSLELGGSE